MSVFALSAFVVSAFVVSAFVVSAVFVVSLVKSDCRPAAAATALSVRAEAAHLRTADHDDQRAGGAAHEV